MQENLKIFTIIFIIVNIFILEIFESQNCNSMCKQISQVANVRYSIIVKYLCSFVTMSFKTE